MATYVLPQVLVFQDFTLTPAAALHPLRAHIAGGHAQLTRFANADEQINGLLGYYDNLVDTVYDWPHRVAGGKIDPAYTKVWIKNALLPYFETEVSGGHDVTKLTGYNNRVHSSNLNFKTNGAYARDALFLDRDVQPGDIVKVRGFNNLSAPVTLWTSVRSIQGDPVAAVVGAASSDAANAGSQGASHTITKVNGIHNGTVMTATTTLYDGLASGYITETYDILVTTPSIGADYTTARLRIISGSGTDDQASVTPAAHGVAFNIGTRGATITITDDDLSASSLSAADAGIPVDALVVGHRWRLTVHQSFTAPTPTSGGGYTGNVDTTYIVTVTKGGTYADSPQISVTTTNGVEISGPTVVPASGTFVAIGTKSTLIKFNQAALRKGDQYYVTVTSSTTGPLRVLELVSNLDTAITAGTELDLTLYILKPAYELPMNRIGFAPQTNWSQSETQITLNAGALAFDASWTDGGVPVALDIVSESTKNYGQAFVEIRQWLSTLCNDVNGNAGSDSIDSLIPGSLTPDNPLKWGVFKALENANGTEVKFSAVCDPNDVDSWSSVLDLLLGRDDVYNLVPLSRDRTIQDLYAANLSQESTPEQGLWRKAFFNLTGVPEIPVVSAGSTIPNHLPATTSDGHVCLCVVEDDPASTGTQYTIVRCPAGNGLFITNGVRAGDIVRVLYTGDGFGNTTYSEFVVDEIQGEDQLRLLSGPGAGISVAAKTEIWRNLNATDEAAEIVKSAGSWGNRRICAVWPDTVTSGNVEFDGYHLCASLAGLASGILPHQGMTHLEIVGYDNMDRTTKHFNRSQLDSMAGGGVWLVTQSLTGGTIYTRHAVTTAPYDVINDREEMIVRNVDSISYRFKEYFAPFIGVTNVTPVIVNRIAVETAALVETLKTELFTNNLGGQLIDATILDLRPHLTLKDRIVLKLGLTVPYALNNLEVHLAI
jgi:hypothetical protein